MAGCGPLTILCWPFPQSGVQGVAAAPPLVVAAVDFDRDADGDDDTPEDVLNRSIVETATAVARANGAALTFVHAWQAPAEGLLQRAAPHYNSGDEKIRISEDTSELYDACGAAAAK